MPFANTIALAERYLPLLDEVYKYSSRSAVLDNPNVQFIGGNAVKVFKTSMDGLGNYSRNNGYVNGNVNGTWETMTLRQDRGRSFQIDRMDNEETLDLAFGTLAGEFIRTKVVPENDAYTFAKLCGATGIQKATAADITPGTTDVPDLIDTATKAMNEAEVPEEGRLLFISETAYEGLKNKIARFTENGERNIYNGIEAYNGMRVIRVPQTRFYTAITQYDGTTSGQEAGGYIGTSGAYPINFLMVHPSAILKVMKHVLPRIFTPDINQAADAWKFDYRAYWDTFVYQNKAQGIYLHNAATALT